MASKRNLRLYELHDLVDGLTDKNRVKTDIADRIALEDLDNFYDEKCSRECWKINFHTVLYIFSLAVNASTLISFPLGVGTLEYIVKTNFNNNRVNGTLNELVVRELSDIHVCVARSMIFNSV